MTVKSAKNRIERRGLIYLDSGENFEHPDNLCAAIAPGVVEQLKQVGVDNPEEFFVGKVIKATGPVMRFEERLYLPILDISQLDFDRAEKKPRTENSQL